MLKLSFSNQTTKYFQGELCVIVASNSPSLVQENAQRLKAYKSSLVLFPRKSKKPKAGDSTGEELTNVTQVTF